MQTIPRGLLACASILVATIPAFAQPPPPPQAPPAKMNPGQPLGLSGILVPRVPPVSDGEIVGLTTSSRLDLLTWERVYALALVRGRERRGPIAEALDTKALDEQAAAPRRRRLRPVPQGIPSRATRGRRAVPRPERGLRSTSCVGSRGSTMSAALSLNMKISRNSWRSRSKESPAA